MPTSPRPHAHARHGLSRGLTLIECCAALAITSVLAASAWPAMTDWVGWARLQGRSQELIADIALLRGQAIATNTDLRLSVHRDDAGACYVLHRGSTDACQCRSDGSAWCADAGVAPLKAAGFPEDSGVRLSATVRSVMFDPRLGVAAPAGTIKLTDARGREIRHIVSLRGRIRSCTPGAATASQPAC